MSRLAVSRKWGLGLGMDVPWDDPALLTESDGQPKLTNAFETFLASEEFRYYFFSVQPRAFDMLFRAPEDYFGLFDLLRSKLPEHAPLALHHTFLNMAGGDPDYPRERIVEFTNQIIRRYDIKWVNEDLGIWSLRKKMLPYPLPPGLNTKSLSDCIANVAFYKERLACPLFVEFPGFSEGASFTMGRMCAFEFFTKVIEETGADCVLDTGHILSYQWLRGKRGVPKLPFEHCREIHLSGCSIVKNQIVDFHHGVLLDEQLELLELLLERCPNLVGVTYEDPKFDAHGSVIPKALRNYERLRARVEEWRCTT